MKKNSIYILLIAHTVYSMDLPKPVYTLNPKFFLENYLKKNSKTELLTHLEKASTKQYLASTKNLLPWLLDHCPYSQLIHIILTANLNLEKNSSTVRNINIKYDPPALKKLIDLYIKDEYEDGLVFCLKNPSLQKFIQEEEELFHWLLKKTNNNKILNFFITNKAYIPKEYTGIAKDIVVKTSLKEVLQKNNKRNLLAYLNNVDVLEYITSTKSVLPWILDQTNNISLIHLFFKCNILVDYDIPTLQRLLGVYLEKGSKKKMWYITECNVINNFIKTEPKLFSWALTKTTNNDFLSILLSRDIIVQKNEKNISKNILMRVKLQRLFKKKKKNDNKKYLLSPERTTLPEQEFLDYISKTKVKQHLAKDQSLFTWATEKTDDPILLSHLIEQGIFTNESHKTVLRKIPVLIFLQKILRLSNITDQINYLKKEEMKKYITTHQETFPLILKETKDPYALKLLIDQGINLNYYNKKAKSTVFHSIAQKKYLHHYDFLFALIARHIDDNAQESTLQSLAHWLEKKYTIYTPFFGITKERALTAFAHADREQESYKNQILTWKNLSHATSLLNPALWKTDSQKRKNLIQQILEYRKKNTYELFEIPSYIEKNKAPSKDLYNFIPDTIISSPSCTQEGTHKENKKKHLSTPYIFSNTLVRKKHQSGSTKTESLSVIEEEEEEE